MLRLTGGFVYDGERGAFAHGPLLIDGRRIAKTTMDPAGSEHTVVDVSGLYLLPGLIDCHVHLVMRGEDADPSAGAGRTDAEMAAIAAEAAERTLWSGTTTARDVGGWNYVEMQLRRDIEAGVRAGPRLFLAGRLLSIPTPATSYYPGMYEVVSGAADVRAAVGRQIARGADVIKVMATGAMLAPEQEDAGAVQFSPEELAAAVAAAEEHARPVAAHAHARRGVENAVLAGAASIEHGTFADDRTLELMAERGTILVPTMAATFAALGDDRVLGAMAPHLRERFTSSARAHVDAVRLARRFGVPIAAGTDAGTPGNNHGDNAMECVYLVEKAGLTPAEAIAAGTFVAAGLIGREADLGALSPGKLADVIGVRADPLRDIRALTRVDLVMKDGAIVRAPNG